MKKAMNFVLIALTLLVCGHAQAVSLIPQDARQVNIDGVIGATEWNDAVWNYVLDTYSGSLSDVLYAKWAAKWSSTTGKIYVIAQVFDSDQQFADSYSLQNQDAVEIFIDAGNSDANGQAGINNKMQQWIIGKKFSTGSWAVLGDSGMSALGLSSYAVTTSGSLITYEAALTPFSFYNKADGSGTVLPLAISQKIGLDVIIDSKSASNFGQLSQNTQGPKSNNAAMLSDWSLSKHAVCTGTPSTDLNNDCIVNLNDFAILASNWLLDNTVEPASPMSPNPSAPVFSTGWNYVGWYLPWYWTDGSKLNSAICEFDGSYIRFEFRKWEDHGYGDVYVDGVLRGQVNEFDDGVTGGKIGDFEVNSLPEGRHTIVVRGTATPGVNGGTNLNVIVPFKTSKYPTLPTFSDGFRWFYVNDHSFYCINIVGSTMTYQVEGTTIKYHGRYFTDGGMMEMSVDGNVVGIIDCYGTENYALHEEEYSGFSPGVHTVSFKMISDCNPASTCAYVNVSFPF